MLYLLLLIAHALVIHLLKVPSGLVLFTSTSLAQTGARRPWLGVTCIATSAFAPRHFHLHVTHLLPPVVSLQWLPWSHTPLPYRKDLIVIRATSSTPARSAALRLLIHMRIITKQFKVFQMVSIPRIASSQSCTLAAAAMSSAASILKVVVSAFDSCCMFTFN